MAKKIIKPNIVGKGRAIPLGDNYYYMRGRKHEQGGIDLGSNPKTGLEVEDGEVVKTGKNEVKVFSAQPILNGESPAEKVLGGDNPNDVFNAQEEFKKRHRLNDDGTSFKNGGRKYIGGTKNETRKKYIKLDKKLVQAVSQIANEYGINPKLLMQRISKEGIIDQAINHYNDNNGENIRSIVDLDGANGFISFGLDWIGDEYKNGDVKTNRKIPFQIGTTNNEHGTLVHPANTLNGYDAIELMAAILKARRDKIKEKYPNIEDLDAAANAAYNLGVKGADSVLKDKSYKTKFSIDKYIKDIEFPEPLKYDLPKNNNVIYTGTDYLPGRRDNHERFSEPYGTKADYYNPVMEMDGILKDEADANNINIVKSLLSNYTNEKRMGGLSRNKDYGSSKKPYPKVNSKDFAGGNRSYPIPTKADAIDALRLAGLHGRSDVRSKVYSKYPELKKDKKEMGGTTVKHKLVEVNIGGNKRLIRVSSSTGERQKAAIGTKYRVRTPNEILADNYLSSSGYENPFGDTAEDVQRKEANKSLEARVSTQFNIPKLNMFQTSNSEKDTKDWEHETPVFKTITPADYIGLSANTIGSIVGGISNRNTIKGMKYSKAPTPISATKLKTRININPQIDKIRETVNRYYRDVDANTASSRVALARKGRAAVDALLQTNELYGNKENIETQLINQDRMNQQAVNARNIEQYNRWAAGKADFENKKREMLSENTISTIDGLNAGVQDLIGRIEGRRNLNNSIAMYSASNPNVTGQILRDVGFDADYYVRDGETRREARKRNAAEKRVARRARKSNKK